MSFLDSMIGGMGGGDSGDSGSQFSKAWELGLRVSEKARESIIAEVEEAYPDPKPGEEFDMARACAPVIALAVATGVLKAWIRKSVKQLTSGDAEHPAAKTYALIDTALAHDDMADAIKAIRDLGREFRK